MIIDILLWYSIMAFIFATLIFVPCCWKNHREIYENLSVSHMLGAYSGWVISTVIAFPFVIILYCLMGQQGYSEAIKESMLSSD